MNMNLPKFRTAAAASTITLATLLALSSCEEVANTGTPKEQPAATDNHQHEHGNGHNHEPTEEPETPVTPKPTEEAENKHSHTNSIKDASLSVHHYTIQHHHASGHSSSASDGGHNWSHKHLTCFGDTRPHEHVYDKEADTPHNHKNIDGYWGVCPTTAEPETPTPTQPPPEPVTPLAVDTSKITISLRIDEEVERPLPVPTSMGTGNIAMSYSGRLPEGFGIRVLNRERAEYALIGDPTSAVTNHGFTFNLHDEGVRPRQPIAIPISINVYADTNNPDREWSDCNYFWHTADYVNTQYHYKDSEYCDDTYGWVEGNDKEIWRLWKGVPVTKYYFEQGWAGGRTRNVTRTVVTETPGITVNVDSFDEKGMWRGCCTIDYTADEGATPPDTIEIRNTNEKYCLLVTDTLRSFCKR